MPVYQVACALLIVAGLSKARSPAGARDALRRARLSVSPGIVRTLAVAEAALGVVAAVRPGALSGAIVAATYAVFCAFVVVLLRAGDRPLGCGCFAGAETGPGGVHVSLNALACGVGVLAALSPPPGIAWILARPALVALPLGLGTAAAAVAVYLVYTAFPQAWRAYRREALS